ncbi:MAG TPA: hypothetical protein ENH49_05055, partial [Candidatus Marinimicrobia bacterium]|nr:hypothetical protein [Candidatus Neomarinimicrobiota bacterium]
MKRIQYLFLFFVTLGTLLAGTTGKLTGVLSDQKTGEPLIGCNIILVGTDLGTASDIDGEYFILNIPPGKYSVRFQMIGYETVVSENVRISTDKTTRLNGSLGMEIIAGSEVVVTAERKLIQFDVTQSESRITSETLDAMPVTEVWDVLRLQGGMTQDAGGGLHMRGGRSSEISYMVDGVPMSDAYDGGISVQIENDNIQELQVISGTFNAEYPGLSGVVNMVTKDGRDFFEGSINTYAGDHTTTDPIFLDLDSYTISNDVSISANMSGPIIPGLITFYSSGRINKSDGWLNGLQTFTMYGDTLFQDKNDNGYRDNQEELKDPYIKSMNWYNYWSTQNKITLKFSPTTRIKINSNISSREAQGYNHFRQLTQGGRSIQYDNGRFFGVNLSHSFSSKSFSEINITESTRRFESYLYEDSLDQRYITPDSLFWAHIEGELPVDIQNKYGSEVNYFPQYTFSRWGVDIDRFTRETKSRKLKFDATSQMNKYNQIKFGFDITRHKL